MLKYGFGRSDLANVFPQFAEINEVRTGIGVEVRKNMDAILEHPPLAEGNRNADGTITQNFDTISRESNDVPETRFVTNDNPILKDAEVHIMSQVRIVSLVTDVPLSELTGGNREERVETQRIRLYPAERKVKRKRARIRAGLKKMYRVGLKLTTDFKTGDDFDFICTFSAVLPRDELQTSLSEQAKRDAGLTSRRSSMRRLEGYSDRELDEELELIRNEDNSEGVAPNQITPQF